MRQIILRARLEHTGGSIFVCFKRREARRAVISPSGPEVPQVLRENMTSSSEGHPWRRANSQLGGKRQRKHSRKRLCKITVKEFGNVRRGEIGLD